MGKFLTDLFTGPDGTTIALGRVYSLPLLLFGMGSMGYLLAITKPPVTMVDMGLGLAGVSGAVGGMIFGTNRIDCDHKG